MEQGFADEALAFIEKSNADLEPELMESEEARELLETYAKIEKAAAYGRTVLAQKLDDAEHLAKVTGTSVGKAKETVETAKALKSSGEVSAAFSSGDISFDQAKEIARAEVASPGSSQELLKTAASESFQVLRDRARKTVLEAEQGRGLAERQKEARSARSHTDEHGMVNVHLKLQPYVGTPIVNRAEAEASRLFKAAKKEGKQEPFERHLADAYAAMFSGSSVKPHSSRPELVIVVSHEVTQRGWTDVRDGEVCKIPGVGPVAPETARRIAEDAFLTGVFYDGEDLRHIKRWTRKRPVEVDLALQLGDPPDFDGVRCVDCGNHFRNQMDHLEPHCGGGTASTDNLKPRCYPCHLAKTARDRKAGKLTPRAPVTVPDRSENRSPP
jgi:5-methylcytosine-specific restriction endonuclease McrA